MMFFSRRNDMASDPETGDDAGVYRTLLESTQAIPWRIDWDTARFTYIGPQIERVLGWSQDSWRTVEDWAMRIHAEDRQKTVDFCVSQSQQGVDHEADYRALTADGEYVWIRDVVHVIRRPDGSVDCLVGFMFDISERKRAEDKILQLQKELEALSYRDPLTGIANRRMFDRILDVEWGKARALGEPLSLVIVDIDYFKQYNDRYGHPQGDACLKEVARVLDRAASRTRHGRGGGAGGGGAVRAQAGAGGVTARGVQRGRYRHVQHGCGDDRPGQQ
jgi:PAS domain S-box-containing protein